MEQIPSLSFVAAASALALEKREMNDDSKLSSPSINIGENPPEVMDSVIKQVYFHIISLIDECNIFVHLVAGIKYSCKPGHECC